MNEPCKSHSDREEVEMKSNDDAAGNTPPPDPTHSSNPSMTSSASTSAATTQQHNRNVTPHTASLMSLFARPPLLAVPATPPASSASSPPYYGSVVMMTASAAPALPGDDDYEPSGSTATPRNTNTRHKAVPNTSAAGATSAVGESLPLLSPSSLRFQNDRRLTWKTSNAIANSNNDENRNETTASIASGGAYSHYRDDTDLINNLATNKTMNATHNHHQLSVIPSASDEDGGGDDEKNYGEVEQDQFQRLLRPTSHSSTKKQIKERYSFLSKVNLNCTSFITTFIPNPHQIKSTIIGAFLYTLYQLVFVFAEASSISRPSHPSSILLSPIASMATLSSLISIPILISALGGDYPALYPMLDMFMAPFLGKMAVDIDEVLVGYQQQEQQRGGGAGLGEDDDTDVFVATFVALNACAMAFCAILCVLASRVKLANLALFLPYPVLCGFFSSVGLSLWMSSFKVDTGITVQQFLGSENRSFLLMKHVPSFISGIALFFLAPKSPVYLIAIIACTIMSAYSIMYLMGTSLHDAQDMGFFWKEEEVVRCPQARHDFQTHLWSPSVVKKICWPAFMNGVPDVIAMGLIYMIRCSLQAAALKRNLTNFLRNKESVATASLLDNGSNSFVIVKDMKEDKATPPPKRKPKDVLEVLMRFANTLFVTALSGGFAVIPAVGLSGTFCKIGASQRAPQYLACLLVLGCYLSDFRLVSFVPKCTFSSLLVMAAIDLLYSNFIKSHQKIRSEWFVIPVIVLAGQAFGVLQSVALGVAISTLMFVAAFYRAGTVKFIANGLILRSSTVERHSEDNVWLDKNGDLIQVLVLQNYLFFGNATSVMNYISSMFDDVDMIDDEFLPPKPKYVVLDLSIVSGMDMSAIDVFADVTSLCKSQGCKLIIAGASRVVRSALIAGGVKSASHLHLSFVEDLEVALGMAEDGLLKFVYRSEEKVRQNGIRMKHLRSMSQIEIGLRLALKEIDRQHNLSFASDLQELEEYTTAMDLEAGEQLDLPRGLYFVESGLINSEHNPSASLTRGRQMLYATSVMSQSTDSIGQLNARSATIGRGQAVLKNSFSSHTFRLCRVGPGWVIGCISVFSGQDIPGTFICVTESRVHYLPFETIKELETSKPFLIVQLYKLLAHLGARRQEVTITQLSTLRSIMSSTAPTRPISRKSMAALSMNFQ